MALPTPQGKQHDVVYLKTSGHQVVLGTAGTGKTVMAIHRAAHLADPRTANNGPVLLLTYTKSLVTYLRHLSAEHASAITIETYGAFARGYLASRGLMGFNSIAGPGLRGGLVAEAVRNAAAGYRPTAFFDRPADFFLDELAWIEGNGLTDLPAYLAAERVGRMAPLLPAQRKAVWSVREQYLTGLSRASKPYDWLSLPSAALAALRSDPGPRRYRHVVVDEAQDLSPEAIRSLAEAVQDGGSLTLFADYAQQIYGQRVSWRSCGLRVRKAEPFLDNYRNSPEIARLALAMADMPHFRDSADLVEPQAPQRAAGAKPTLVRMRSRDAEAELVSTTAADFGKTQRVGVLARTRAEARRATAGVRGVRMLHDDMTRWDVTAGVYAGTYHSAKGLEFDVVLLPFCGADRLPEPETVAAFGEDEAAARESRLLYVGVTRARDELVVTCTGEPTRLFPGPASGLWAGTGAA